MASKIFLDANFLLDITLKRGGFADASTIMRRAIDGELSLMTTPAVLHITGYFTAQAYGSAQAKKILLTLLNDVRVIDCDHDTALVALGSSMEDTEDALQYYTALRYGVEYFLSSDKKLKKAALPQLPVYTPAELLDEI